MIGSLHRLQLILYIHGWIDHNFYWKLSTSIIIANIILPVAHPCAPPFATPPVTPHAVQMFHKNP